MNNNSIKKYFALHGLTGFLLAVVILLSIAGILGFLAVTVQQRESVSYYEVNRDVNAIKSIDNNRSDYISEKK
jgi:hypothetical protein